MRIARTHASLTSRAVCGRDADVLIPGSYHQAIARAISPFLYDRCSKPDRVAHVPHRGRPVLLYLGSSAAELSGSHAIPVSNKVNACRVGLM
jgi:hypothetical protein